MDLKFFTPPDPEVSKAAAVILADIEKLVSCSTDVMPLEQGLNAYHDFLQVLLLMNQLYQSNPLYSVSSTSPASHE